MHLEHIIGEVARLYLLVHLENISNWSLSETQEDFWINGFWNTTLVNPPPLDAPPVALEEMRRRNEEEKRQAEKAGPSKTQNKSLETPEERFNRAFEELPQLEERTRSGCRGGSGSPSANVTLVQTSVNLVTAQPLRWGYVTH